MKKTKTTDELVEEVAGGREFELSLCGDKVVFEMTFTSKYAASVAYHELVDSANDGHIGLRIWIGGVTPATERPRPTMRDRLCALLARWSGL